MKKKDKEPFHDLLVPILLILVVLPLVIRLAVYDCGYQDYAWYGGDGIRTDLYSYYKNRLFLVLAIFCAGILPFRLFLYREKTKEWKLYLPLFGYAGMALLSALLSKNPEAAFVGNLDSFENVLVLIGYAVVSFYTYQVLETEKDYRVLWYGLLVILGIFLVVGGLQLFRIDPVDYEWFQKLIMTEEQFEIYGGTPDDTFTGNNVYLTLYNPNYAGVYLTMIVSVTAVMALTEEKKKQKIFYGLASLVALVLIWFTYSRATLVSLAVGAVVLAACLGKGKGKRILRYGVPGAVLVLLALIAADWMQGSYYLSRMFDSVETEPLEELRTLEDGVYLAYDGKTYRFSMEGEEIRTESAYELPEDVSVYPLYGEYGLGIGLYLADTEMEFVRLEEGYFYRTPWGKLDQIVEIPAVDFHGLEALGSGRVYIWSRVLPILKKYLFVGSGPDTFAESFPQNDYAGKVVYANHPGRIIEKAHNDLLTKWVQTGMVSVVCCVAFYVLFLRKGMGAYRGKEMRSMAKRLGLGCFIGCVCYLDGSLFNDSTIQTAPLFWVFTGIALSAAAEKGKEG
ncbi:MAG: O-antigen ligase family protein [Eubacteriales bacterium]|nr:O-antigen ligase family protein [Eubacteriales bacterium]